MDMVQKTRGGEDLLLEPISPQRGFNTRVNVMPQCGEGGSTVRVLIFSLGFKITLFVPVFLENPARVAGFSFLGQIPEGTLTPVRMNPLAGVPGLGQRNHSIGRSLGLVCQSLP